MLTRIRWTPWQMPIFFLALVATSYGLTNTAIGQSASSILVQEYAPPPKIEFPDIPKATPAPDVLTQKDRDRLDSLVPLLAGKQELWVMGEFVHYAKHSVPFVVKALKMPGPRIRYNAIETLSMIKDPAAVPELLAVATNPEDISRVRTHAIRVATRLDSDKVHPAIKVMAKDENSTIRRTAVFEARNVRKKEVLPILIDTIGDPEKFVSITALESFWRLTGFSGSQHHWEMSTEEERKEWSKEWAAWLKENENRLEPSKSQKHPFASPSS